MSRDSFAGGCSKCKLALIDLSIIKERTIIKSTVTVGIGKELTMPTRLLYTHMCCVDPGGSCVDPFAHQL